MKMLDLDKLAPADSSLRFETIRFDWHRIYAAIPKGIGLTPEHVTFEVNRTLARMFVPKLIGKSVEFRRPLDWWEAVKERWLPARLRRRFPVKYHVETVRLSSLYPRARVPANMGTVVHELTLVVPGDEDRAGLFFDEVDLRRRELYFVAGTSAEILSDRESRVDANRLRGMVNALLDAIGTYRAAREAAEDSP